MGFDLAFVDRISDDEWYAPVVDDFSVAATSGWGTTRTGQAWTTSGGSASDYSVSGGVGRHSVGAVASSRYTILDVNRSDADVSVTAVVGVTPTGASIVASVFARMIDTSNYYVGEIVVNTGSSVDVRIRSVVAGVSTTLDTATNVVTHTASKQLRIRFQVSTAVGPLAVLKAKVWDASLPEPAAWHASTTDSGLLSAGDVGCRTFLTTSNSNSLPVTVTYDGWFVQPPINRLCLISEVGWRATLDTDWGMPELRRAVSSTLLTDGDVIPAAAYANRTITLSLVLLPNSLTEDEAATAFQQLSRELNRQTNILRFQQNTTEAVFFRTHRADFRAHKFERYARRATVQVPADPFAYGPLESLPNITIDGDPASANAIYADVGPIKGDVETPLLLRTQRYFSSPDRPARQGVFGVRRVVEDESVMVGFAQAESLTLGTDASTQTVSGYSGGTPNCVRVSFATATLQSRLSGRLPLPSAPEARGRYRVYARVKKSVSGDTVTMQLRWGGTTPTTISNTAVTLPTGTDKIIVELGDVSSPVGADPVYDGYSGVELNLSSTTAPLFDLLASRTGSGNLEIDFLAFIPADDQLALVSFPAYGGGSGPRLIWDGPNSTVYRAAPSSVLDSSPPASLIGASALMVSPRATNRIFSLYDVTPAAITTLTGETYEVAYWPRYLVVRGPVE